MLALLKTFVLEELDLLLYVLNDEALRRRTELHQRWLKKDASSVVCLVLLG